MFTAPVLPAQRTLAYAAAWLVLVGLLTGLYASAAMSGLINADGHSALAAHLTALAGAFLIHAVAWTLPLLRYGPIGQRRLAWLVIVFNFVNWFLTLVKSMLHVRGINSTGNLSNDVIYVLLVVFVVVPALVASVAWVAGFRPVAASAGSPSGELAGRPANQ